MLSVVIPVRCRAPTRYLLPRLAALVDRLAGEADTEVVVVDSASAPAEAAAMRRLCAQHGAALVTDPHPVEPFAPGIARNLGAERATGDTLVFFDADLRAPADLFARVRAWAAAPPAPQAFLLIPSLYATRAETRRLEADPEADLAPLVDSLLAGDNHRVSLVALSTSTVAVARDHFFAIGGNNPAYLGHGCEDFDLLHRLASRWPHARRPADYYEDVRTRFPGDYRGFRAYLAHYALPLLFDGLFTVHLWHDRPVRRRYFRQRRRNERLLQANMRAADAAPGAWAGEGTEPPPPLADAIAAAMRARGLDPDRQPGLFRWRPGVVADGRARSRLRKLVVHPHEFFADSRVPLLRPLRRLFPK
ncbi:MAG: glycosyltransferase [Deltaproteobacteria bacterium]|nr:MAG: glycosyltransferase [Deltaproteobacteria bacterium]